MSKRRDDNLLLEDILECIGNIYKYTVGMTYAQFIENQLVLDAVVRNLEIIGEASGKLSQTSQEAMAGIPWQKIKGLRNRVIHAYFDVSKQVIWFVIQNELTILQQVISGYLEQQG